MKQPWEKLYDYLHGTAKVSDLRSKATVLDTEISRLDDSIETADAAGLDDVVETLCVKRNRLNLDRINILISANSLEKQLLEFEKERMLAE